MTPNVDEGFSWGFEVERHDWGPIWGLCKDIQESFRGTKEFDSREAHQAAWDRFQQARQEASRRADIEKQNIADQSLRYKQSILDDARRAYWSKSADFFVGAVLGQTTKEEMIELQQILKRAGQSLSEHKHKMTKEDKQECFEAIQDAQATHDDFWGRYREHQAVAHQERADKHAAWQERTRENIARNEERRSKAEHALERVRQNIRDNYDKLSDAWSDEFRERVQGWIDEGEEKASDIEASIDRLTTWIEEDEAKLLGS